VRRARNPAAEGQREAALALAVLHLALGLAHGALAFAEGALGLALGPPADVLGFLRQKLVQAGELLGDPFLQAAQAGLQLFLKLDVDRHRVVLVLPDQADLAAGL